MHPQVRQLLEVQKVDKKFSRLRRGMESIPRERAQREEVLERARQAHAALEARLKKLEVDESQAELTIRQADAELEKLQVRLNTVKNNAEYQATLLQIESVKRERGNVEKDGLELIDAIEEVRKEVGESRANLDEEEQTFAAFVKEGETFVTEKRDEFDRMNGERNRLLDEVPPDTRELYERLFSARKGTAVVAMEGTTCTGCYTSVQPNLVVKVQAGTALVQCDSCQRILYVPE